MMRRWPPLFQFLAVHMAIGIAIGWAALGAMLAFDMGGIRTLIWASSWRWIALAMLAIGFAVTFGSVSMGMAVMGKGDDDDGPPGGKRERTVSAREPVAVRAR
ncbi:MAG: hypothetical protein EAZ99_14880 [Alphaproteobacteria bacterium]|nr:MAG: hypothetical protein EAZ99_14880 [Alphaproteobacteria bacterium]